MENLDIKWEFVDNRKTLYKAFLSCKKIFWEEELDPYKWWIEYYENTKNGTMKNPYYCLLWFYNNKIVAWISWNIFTIDNIEIAWIWYIWVDKEHWMQKKWIWTFLIEKVENYLISNSEKNNNNFWMIILESNKEIPELNIKSSIWFWEKKGYKKIENFNYFSPCVSFDPKNWDKLLKDVPLKFMVKTFKNDVLKTKFFKDMIDNIYIEWYSQDKENFENIDAFNKANKYIEDSLHKITDTFSWDEIKLR